MPLYSLSRYILRSPMTVANEEEPQASFFEVPSEAQIRHESMLINEVSLIWRKKEPLFQ